MNAGGEVFSGGGGFFHNAHHFTIYQPTMIDGSSAKDTRAMDSLMNNSIPGVEFDASERYPPPSCHPETRLDISGQIYSWLHDSSRKQNMLWLHGPAGVGKSAIMQTLAESDSRNSSCILGASVFFSKRKRCNDLRRVCATVAYQLAVKHNNYRKYVVDLLSTDPSIIRKSMVEQFRRLIAKPFALEGVLSDSHKTTLILLDGLDECDGETSTREFILLIGRFVQQYPRSPLLWIVASRPESHIKSSFSHSDVRSSHIEIHVPVNSSQSCADVERYLRDRFDEIRQTYTSLFPPNVRVWPAESDFLLIAANACGLFIFASTIIRFTEDESYNNPVSQLRRVLCAIRTSSLLANQCNPFVALDSLYAEILTSVPPQVLPSTMDLLTFALVRYAPFGVACNWLGLTQADAYSALRKLQSVLNIPPPEAVSRDGHLAVFHTSFLDYLSTPSRSKEFTIDDTQAWERLFRVLCRVLLNSYRPGTGLAVDVSRIRISWSYRQEELQVQKEVFEISLRWSLMFSNEVRHPEDQLCEQLAGFFEELDYGALSPLLPQASDAGRICYLLCTSAFFHALENRKLIRKTELQTLDLNRLRPSSSASGQLLRRYGCSNTEAEVQPESPLLLEGFEEMAGPTCNDPYWKTHLLQHLFIIMNFFPSPDIFLIGKGRKSCVLILKSKDDYLWHYLLPYDQS